MLDHILSVDYDGFLLFLFMVVGATLVVSGDGRYFSKDAIQVLQL